MHYEEGRSWLKAELLACVQFGQRYVEEQDDKTVTEWMRKQVCSPALYMTTSNTVDIQQEGSFKGCDSGLQALFCT